MQFVLKIHINFVNKLLDLVRVSKRAESVKESKRTRGWAYARDWDKVVWERTSDWMNNFNLNN